MYRSLPSPISRFPEQDHRNASKRSYAGQNASYRVQNRYQNDRAPENPPRVDFRQRYNDKQFESQYQNRDYNSDARYRKEPQQPRFTESEHNYRREPQYPHRNSYNDYRYRVVAEKSRDTFNDRSRVEPQNTNVEFRAREESQYSFRTGNLDYKDKEMPRYSQQNDEIYREMKQLRYAHHNDTPYRYNGDSRYSNQNSAGDKLYRHEPRYPNQSFSAHKAYNEEPQFTGQKYSDRSQYREEPRYSAQNDHPRCPYRDEPRYSNQNYFPNNDKPCWQAQNAFVGRNCKEESRNSYQSPYMHSQAGAKQQHPDQYETAPSRYNGPRHSDHNDYMRDNCSTTYSRYSDRGIAKEAAHYNGPVPYYSNRPANQGFYRLYDYRAPIQSLSSTCEQKESTFVLNPNATEFIPNPALTINESKMPLLVVFDLNGVLIWRKKKAQIVRPFAHEFIDFVAKHFYIAVWSSARRENVDSMVSKAFLTNRSQLLECWDRSDCELNGRYNDKCDSFKNLSKLWASLDKRYSSRLGFKFDENNTVIIDDSPTKIKYQPANQIRISEYAKVDPEDVELQQLKAYFELLIEKLPKDTSFNIRDFLQGSKFNTTKESNLP